jgi:hypothetical protein
VSFNYIQRKVKLIKCFTAKLEIPQFDVTRPNANVKLLGIEVSYIEAKKSVEEVCYERLEHGVGWGPSPWPGELYS